MAVSGRGDFTLRETATRRLKASAGTVHQFDVLATDDRRLGIACVTLEVPPALVREFGHVCVTLAEAHSTAVRFAEVATALFDATFRCRVAEIRVVVPGDHTPSLQACVSLHPAGPAESFDLRGNRYFAFRYSGAS